MNNEIYITMYNLKNDGMSVKDIAIQFGFTEKKVYNCIAKAKKIVRRDYIIRG